MGRGRKQRGNPCPLIQGVPEQALGLPWASGEVGQVMSGPTQQPTPIPDKGERKDRRRVLGRVMRLRDTIRKNKRTIRKHKNPTHCCTPNPSTHTPNNNRCSWTHQMYTMNILIFLFILRFVGLPCTLWKAGITIPTFKKWNRGLEKHEYLAQVMLLGPDRLGDTQAH